MNFHLGKPILVLLAIAFITGAATWFHKPPDKAELTLWVFAESHHRTYAPLVEKFEHQHDVRVNLMLLNSRAEITRLGQLFMADLHDPEIPDMAELEISLVGRFFRPPVNEVGFLPLDDRLANSPWKDQLPKTRLATWSKAGVTFGMPHDVHPCVIAYRDDLFQQAGVNLPDAKTWTAFHEACLKFETYWRDRGVRYRHAFEMSESSADTYQPMLLQRGLNPIDSYGNVLLDKDPRFAQTLAFHAQMVAGPRKVTAQPPNGMVAFGKDLVDGNVCAFLMPDWRLTYMKLYAPQAAGKCRIMPVPVFDPATDVPTTTIGGTMMGITRACRNPELAWQLLEFLYFSEEGLKARRASTDILPPTKSMWTDPYYHTPDPYFGNQKAGEVLVSLAGQVPPRYVTPVSPIVNSFLNDVVAKSTKQVNEHGTDGLEPLCKKWLDDVAAELRLRMNQWSVD